MVNQECRGAVRKLTFEIGRNVNALGRRGSARTHTLARIGVATHIPNLARDMTTRGASAALLAVRRLLSPKLALDTTFFHGTGGLTRCDELNCKGR